MSSNTIPLDCHTAPPGHITLTPFDRNLRGHSAMFSKIDFYRMDRGVKKPLGSLNCIKTTKGSIEIIKNVVGCDGRKRICEAKNTLPAFIALTVKHPEQRLIKPNIRYIGASAIANEGAHITILFFGDREFARKILKLHGTFK
jgi:hypothetical protein